MTYPKGLNGFLNRVDIACHAPYHSVFHYINGELIMSLTPAQIRRLKDVFNEAVKNHPNPDSPVLHPAGKVYLSPRQLAREIEKETPMGMYFINMIDDVVTKGGIPFDIVLKELQRPRPPKPF
jgi:hypothetical protein